VGEKGLQGDGKEKRQQAMILPICLALPAPQQTQSFRGIELFYQFAFSCNGKKS